MSILLEENPASTANLKGIGALFDGCAIYHVATIPFEADPHVLGELCPYLKWTFMWLQLFQGGLNRRIAGHQCVMAYTGESPAIAHRCEVLLRQIPLFVAAISLPGATMGQANFVFEYEGPPWFIFAFRPVVHKCGRGR